MTRTERRLLLAVCLVGLVLRLVGIGWGLPSADHLYSYHPDEWQAVETAISMVARGSANPRFFNYPSLQPGLLMVLLYAALGFAGDAGPGFPYLLGRLVSVVFGVGTIWVVALIARRLAGPRAGLIAAGLLAVVPLHVVNSHFATVDVPLAFWSGLALLGAVAVVQAGDGSGWRPLLLAAVAAGLAASTKYNGALMLAPLWAAAALGWGRRWAPAALAACGVAALTFALTSPFVLLDPAAWPQVRFELFEHPRATNLYTEAGPGWLFHLTRNLPTGVGWIAALAAVAGLTMFVRSRNRAALPLLAGGLLMALSLLRSAELFIRYWLPLLPVITVAAGCALARVRGRYAYLVLALVAAGPALRSRAYVAMIARPDARDAALAWCRANLRPGASVGLPGSGGALWFQDVPLQPNNGGLRTGALPGDGPFSLRLDPPSWPADPPDYLCLNRTTTSAGDAEAITTGYRPVSEFESAAVVLSRWIERGPDAPLLHDWNYTRPCIVVYARADGD